MTILLRAIDRDPFEDGVELAISNADWSAILALAQAHGWKRPGTLASPPTESDELYGNPTVYGAPHYRVVAAEDGAALADVLEPYSDLLEEVVKLLRSGRVSIA